MNSEVWAWRATSGAAAAVALGILGFYVARLAMPLPIFAADEGAYLIRALFTDDMVARNPFVVEVTNGVHLSLIRIAYRLGDGYVIWDRLANAAAYLGGLLALWWMGARRAPRSQGLALLLIVIGFPYYRFAFSNMPEGLFVGVLAAICLATQGWWRRRPAVHAAATGALCAILVLTKPHGVAMIAALLALALVQAAADRRMGVLALRIALFAASFLVLGNLIQWGAHEPVAHPLTFFIGDFYDHQLALHAPVGAATTGLVGLGAMVAAMAVLAGPALLIGTVDLIRRPRTRWRDLAPADTDLSFVLLTLALVATLAMTAIFVMKVSGTPGETGRLWGRYFEFFAPMIWLAAAPALGRLQTGAPRWLGVACAGVVLAGLAGLFLSFQAGIVLFPWDSSILTAFFHADPARAAVPFKTPYRVLATAATVLAAAALALRMAPARAGAGLILALGVLSTVQDHVWVGPLIQARGDLERDLVRILPALPAEGELALLADDANEGHLGFLRLEGRPYVYLGPPAQTPALQLATAQVVIVTGPAIPPGGPWRRSYQGTRLSVFERSVAAP